jgi:predicted Fe-Mo cluster-binding NifX family protein
MMRIAIPTDAGRLFPHFGRARSFSIFDVDPESKQIRNFSTLDLSGDTDCREIGTRLKGEGVELVIAGGIGAGAAEKLSTQGIELCAGAETLPPQMLVTQWLAGELAPGAVGCADHEHGHHEHRHRRGSGRGDCNRH